MDELAEMGMLVVTEGATAPLIITTQETTGQELQPGPEFTPLERDAADTVFVAHQKDTTFSMPAVLLMVGASVATLKSIAIDEQKSHEREEEEEELADEPETAERKKTSK